LTKFLDFWTPELDRPLHGVTIVPASLITPAEMRRVDGEFLVH
jgi:uncharacterized protein Usg